MKMLRMIGIALAVAGVMAASIWADANPEFTPLDLVRNSNRILLLEFQSVDANSGLAVAKVQRVLKGKYAPKDFRVNLLAMDEPLLTQGRAIVERIRGGGKQAMLFEGAYDTKGMTEGEEANATRFFLHVTNMWLILNEGEGGVWDLETIFGALNMTWDGGTDMLLRCAEYVLSDPNADVPCEEGVDWDANGITRFGRMPGKVFAATGVDVTGTGKADLFLGGEAGDRLYRWDGKVLADVTARTGLAGKSRLAAWGDFNGDGRLDLASGDGKALSILWQKPDGTFAAPKDAGVGEVLKDGCLSLATLDAGTGAKAGLLVGTKGWPVLLVPKEGGFTARPLGTGEFAGKGLGGPGACLAADLDGDGLVDVLQMFARGSLLCKGTAPGVFAAGVRVPVGFRSGRCTTCLGDFDGDGLPDIFIAGESDNFLWQNLGGGRFEDVLRYSGELDYVTRPGAVAAQCGDINNDGRQDVFLGWDVETLPQVFFNRGFRSLMCCFARLDLNGQRNLLERTDPVLVPQAAFGQQAACWGDFNGDGALDMVLVLTGRASMAKQDQYERGKAIAAGATIYWDANTRLVTDAMAPGRPIVGKAEAAVDANEEVVSVLVDRDNLVFFPRAVTKENGAGAVVSLPLLAPTPGPVNVLAYNGKRLLGAWTVRAGDPGTIIGTRLPATITLKWTWPGGRTREKQVQVQSGPVRVLLDGN